MLDIKLIRENPELVKKDLKKRGDLEKIELVDELLELDRRAQELKKRSQELRRKRNELTREIAELKKKNMDIKEKLREAEEIPKLIKEVEGELEKVEGRIREILMILPNLLHESVPVGESEEDNVVVRTWGKIRKFDFEPKDHVTLLLNLDIVDLERAAKISGARFFFLKNEGVLLEHALMRYAIDLLLKKGFKLLEPPFMLRRKPYEGVISMSDFEEMIYKIEGEDLYLIATSEHPLISMFMNEVIPANELPIKLIGFSANFRKEAGAHGKDTKGIFRTHQFYKVEQIIICRPEDSWNYHEELIKNAEEIFQGLEIPYRVVNVCTGDIGTVAAKKYDLEAWIPAQNKYREMVSCSNCTDYQARRLNIKFRERPGEKAKLVHTLNSTAITTRAIVALVENFQEEDGSVRIPKALVPYMNGIEVLKCRKK